MWACCEDMQSMKQINIIGKWGWLLPLLLLLSLAGTFDILSSVGRISYFSAGRIGSPIRWSRFMVKHVYEKHAVMSVFNAAGKQLIRPNLLGWENAGTKASINTAEAKQWPQRCILKGSDAVREEGCGWRRELRCQSWLLMICAKQGRLYPRVTWKWQRTDSTASHCHFPSLGNG